MEAKVEQAANKIKRLKACIDNLISVGVAGKPPQIVSALLDMLPHVEPGFRTL